MPCIIYDVNNDAVFFDADGDGAIVAVHFATLVPALALSNTEFVVV